MSVPSSRAAIRFGYGLGRADTPRSGAEALARLDAPDRMPARYPVLSGKKALELIHRFRQGRKTDRKGGQGARKGLRAATAAAPGQMMARILDSPDPLRERLTWFWADHFTAVARNAVFAPLGPAYIDEAIRPHVTGRFADMLRATVTHPFMLFYLDQAGSVGPNSRAGRRKNRKGRGMSENLAREVLELHTLGVSSSYGQRDVEQLAELFTGLGIDYEAGFVFDPAAAEPGAELLLGQSFGGPLGRLEPIGEALEMLALHPDTARHIAHKLVVHFVSDTPPDGLIDHVAAAYADSGGALLPTYSALLEDPRAWGPPEKIKRPMELVASGLLACGVTGAELVDAKPHLRRQMVDTPQREMGQPFLEAAGPDGFPEEAAQWITPQRLAARIRWAMELAPRMQERTGEPAAFLEHALAEQAGGRLAWAVGAAEQRSEAVALVLASAEFNAR